MAHLTNRKAFCLADAKVPLFRLYTLLVAAELALKDALGRYEHGHDIEGLAKEYFGNSLPPALDAQLTATLVALGALRCTLRGGSSAPVRPAKYPDIRYLRLIADGYADGSTDSLVQVALDNVIVLQRELERAGVRL